MPFLCSSCSLQLRLGTFSHGFPSASQHLGPPRLSSNFAIVRIMLPGLSLCTVSCAVIVPLWGHLHSATFFPENLEPSKAFLTSALCSGQAGEDSCHTPHCGQRGPRVVDTLVRTPATHPTVRREPVMCCVESFQIGIFSVTSLNYMIVYIA